MDTSDTSDSEAYVNLSALQGQREYSRQQLPLLTPL